MLARWSDFFLYIFLYYNNEILNHIHFIIYILKYPKHDFSMIQFREIEHHDFSFHYL